MFCILQSIIDTGTYEELCGRQSITTECIFSEEEDTEDDDDEAAAGVAGVEPSAAARGIKNRSIDSGDTVSLASIPEGEAVTTNLKKRRQSMLQYMRDQQSIDDPVDKLAFVSFTSFILFCSISRFF